jgi:hypothetical protein
MSVLLFGGCGKSASQTADSGAVSCATVGCFAPPLCSLGCTATCGCCSCAEGERQGDLVCHGGCYEPSDAGTSDASPTSDSRQPTATGDAETSSVNCATVGCSAPPLCSLGCTATCGCCSCAEGERQGDLVCHGGCYAPADGGADASDATPG